MNFLKRHFARNLFLIARAFVFSLLCSLPALYVYISSNGYSPAILSDWDEAYYLPYAYQTADIPLSSFYSLGQSNIEVFEKHQLNFPHYSLDVLLGRYANFFGLAPAELGLSLDLICVFLAYLLTTCFLRLLFASNKLSVELGSIIAIKLPWIFCFDELLSLALGNNSPIKLYAHQFFQSEPALRGSYTQISFVSFVLVLLFLILSWRSRSIKALWSFLSALATGLLLYQYFFAWGAALVLGLSSNLLRLVFDRSVARSLRIRDGLIYASLSLAISLPGLILLFREGSLYTPGPGLHMRPVAGFLDFSGFWYFGPLSFLVAVWMAALLLKRKKNPHSNLAPALTIVVLIAAQFVLMNLQPLLGRWMTPYHFPLFFLHPIVSAVVMLFILQKIKSQPIRHLMSTMLVMGVLFLTAKEFQSGFNRNKDHEELMQFLQEDISEQSVIASIPFGTPLFHRTAKINYQAFPLMIETFTKHKSFSLLLGFEPDRENMVKKELVLGLLLSGTVQPLKACPLESATVDATDVLSGADAFLEAQRLSECSIMDQLIASNPPCSLATTYSFDYIVLDTQIQSYLSEASQSFSAKIWESKDKTYFVYKYDSDRAKSHFCKN